MKNNPEIKYLSDFSIKHKIEIRFSSNDILADNQDYKAANIVINGKCFSFYVEDEYNDARYNYPLLNLCLVLRELELYNESEDYLIWCRDRYFEPGDTEVLAHFKNLGTIYREIASIVGKIESFVSDWDFEMGSGAMYELRKVGI